MSRGTLYEVLGVGPGASAEELRRAYLAQARRHHPDAGGEGPAMTRLNEAWRVLSDPVRRRQYDLELGVAAVGDPVVGEPVAGGHRLPFDADPADLVDVHPLTLAAPKRSLALVPPGLFAASVAVGCLALVFGSPAMLAAAAVLFFLAGASIAAVAMWTMRSGARRR